jgi:enoyl-CoA hydratase/carnithine racemase
MSSAAQQPDILMHEQDAVCTLTLNRADKKNSLTSHMYDQLATMLNHAQGNPSVRVLVIQGSETVFCAGNDIVDFIQNPPNHLEAPVFRFLQALVQFSKPLIAAVCGPAVGIGTTMLFHADMVFAGDNAVFSMPFVNLGICPEAGSSLLAPSLMGYQRAAQALLMGEPFMAEAAQEAGLVNQIVPPTELKEFVQRQALKLAAKPLASVMQTKRLLKAHHIPLLEQRIREEGEMFSAMLSQPAALEAMKAFVEKRKPDFTGL